MSVTVNQSETEFDDVIISDWPSVIICLLIGAGRWQIDLALMQVLYNIYIYIYTVFFYGATVPRREQGHGLEPTEVPSVPPVMRNPRNPGNTKYQSWRH